MQEWMARTAMLLGEEGVARLGRASVAVFGLGGVGSYTAEALARAGVGRLILVDGDTVSATNINRQLVALQETIGQPKAAVMAARVRSIHPTCRVEVRPLYYLPPEGAGLIDGCDYVADAIDMVTAKLALVEECAAKGVPLISAMGCGNKLDPTRLRVVDIYQTSGCPLCRVMRRELRQRGIGGLRVVFSDEAPRRPLCVAAPDETVRRAVPGSVSFVPSVAGLILAGEIVCAIAGVPRSQ